MVQFCTRTEDVMSSSFKNNCNEVYFAERRRVSKPEFKMCVLFFP